MPLDMYFRVLFTKTQPKPKAESARTDSTASKNRLQGTIGQLALHPNLPLLVAYISGSSEIISYNTGTCKKLQKFQIRLPKIIGDNGSAVRCSITCLKFSAWSKLAIGLSDGTVRVVEQNLRAMLAAEDVDENKRLRLQEVKPLPCGSSDVSFKFIGPITNLVFPSTADITAGGDSWLAITTENSGVWIWDEKTRQPVRVINTAGINQGCMHWISLSVNQSPVISALERNRRLNDSSHRKLGTIFGSSDNLSGLDEYYSSSPGNSKLSNLARSPTPLPRPRADSLRYSSGVVTLQAPVYDAGSLLVFGTKDGQVQVNKIFHSYRMMHFITSVNFYPAAITQTISTFQPIPGPASGEITHLVTQSHQITQSSIALPIFVASKGNNSSTLNQFSVTLLRKQIVKSGPRQFHDITEATLHNLVNLVLSLNKACYRWLPLSRPTDPTQGSITNHIEHFIQPPPSSATKTAPERICLISACTQPGTDLILTTLHINHLSQCVIFAHNHSSAKLCPMRVNPLFPIPISLSKPLIPSLSLLKGHYIKQLATVGLYTPASSSLSSRTQEVRVGMTRVHDITCEEISWGKSEHGGNVGAFIYIPASSIDEGIAIGMFEVSI